MRIKAPDQRYAMALRGGRQLLQLLASSNASQTCSRLPQQAPLCAAASCSWQGTAGTLPSAPCSTQQHPQHQQRRWRSHSSSEGDKWRMLAQRGEKLVGFRGRLTTAQSTPTIAHAHPPRVTNVC